MLLLCSFFRLEELFQVKNGLTTSLLFFLKMPQIWVGWTTLNGEKKEDGLKEYMSKKENTKLKLFCKRSVLTQSTCSGHTTVTELQFPVSVSWEF